MEVLHNFHNLHEMVKYEEIYEHSYVEEFHPNCSISKTRDFLCARNWEFVSTMQHIKTVEKPQGFWVFKTQLVGKYVKHSHPNEPTKGDSVVFKGSKQFKEIKKGAGKPLSYPIEIDQEILFRLLEMMDPHLPISSLNLRKFVISKIQPYCEDTPQLAP